MGEYERRVREENLHREPNIDGRNIPPKLVERKDGMLGGVFE